MSANDLRSRTTCFTLAAIGALLLSASTPGGTIVHVDDDAAKNGDGLSWASAYRFLQDAVEFASDPGNGVSEIRVAQGSYFADESEAAPNGTADREVSFQLINGVVLAGGYAGLGEPDPDARDLLLYITVLDGDLSGNDIPGAEFFDPSFQDNTIRLVDATGVDDTAVLDGFMLTNGHAFGGLVLPSRGGGVYCEGSPLILSCHFVDNRASNAGGIYAASGAQPSIVDCVFIDNYSHERGAAIWADNAAAIIVGCTFEANIAELEGGGYYDVASQSLVDDCTFTANLALNDRSGAGAAMYFQASDSLITNCLFEANWSGGRGAAVRCRSGGALRFENCGFFQNESHIGGAVYSSDSAAPDFIRCTFEQNVAEDFGGAMVLASGASQLVDCRFFGNIGVRGGAIGMENTAFPHYINTIFSGNIADEGGAIHCAGAITIRLSDCTLSGNTAETTTGGILVIGTDNIFLNNNILWGNTDATGQTLDAQLAFDRDPPEVFYSCIQGLPDGQWGRGNINVNPLFVDPDGADGVVGTADDDLHLNLGSPCIDQGSNELLPVDEFDLDGDDDSDEALPLDFEGDPRIIDKVVDMGADESSGGVAPGEYVGPKGGSWFDPANWAGGEVPDEQTNVFISTSVVIDGAGAVAATVIISDGGHLTILPGGDLTTGIVDVLAGGAFTLTDASVVVDVENINVEVGGAVNWMGGTINLAGGIWSQSETISVGCIGSSALNLADGALVIAPQIDVCASGAVTGNGTLMADVTNDGQIHPGSSTGTLSITGTFDQGASGHLEMELEDLIDGSNDRLEVDGDVGLAGQLTVVMLEGAEAAPAVVDVLVAGFIQGSFDVVELPRAMGEFDFSLVLSQTTAAVHVISNAPQGDVIYVNAAGSPFGTGASWPNATTDLQFALTAVEKVGGLITEVWVAAGSYIPTRQTDDDPRSVTFQLLDGVGIYGGFAGGEKTLEERNPDVNATVLTGDVLGDDDDEFSNVSDNAFQVITANGTDSTAILDGFTITRGYFGENVDGRGAGVICITGSSTIRNCVIEMNRAHSGSGMYVQAGTPTLTNCRFINNTNSDPGASSGHGGGLAILEGTVSLFDCAFMGNGTSRNGGAIYMRGDVLLIIENCDFTENEAVDSGGGLYAENGVVEANGCVFSGNRGREADHPPNFGGGASFVFGSATLTGCTFNSNLGVDGAGFAASITGIQLTIEDCVFDGNVATGDGGGMLIDSSSPTLVNCEFINNVSADRGGGVYAIDQFGSEMNPVFQSCLFQGNSAILGGGVAAVVGNALPLLGPTFIDCQFVNNSADEEGGGLRSAGADTELSDCTFEGNTAPLGSAVYNIDGGAVIRGNPTLLGVDELASAQTLAPGLRAPGLEVGVFDVAGTLRLVDRGSEFEDDPTALIDVGGTIPGVEFDVIDVNQGVAELTGGLFVKFIDDFLPTELDTFDVLTAGSRAGQFGVAFFPQLPDGLLMSLVNHDTGVTLTVEPFEGDIIFNDPEDLPINGLPTDAILGDFDTDGDEDLALVVQDAVDGNRLIVLRNAGLDREENWLGFTEGASEFAVGASPSALAAGFFDEDVHLDLVVADAVDSTVSIFLNTGQGDGGFVHGRDYFVGAVPRAIAVGSVDGNGAVDLAVANFADNTISILLGAGDGTFAVQKPFAAESQPSRVELSDLDGDTDQDIVVLNGGKNEAPSKLSVHLNNGVGVFDPPLLFDAGESAADLMIADFNNDGFDDAIATNEGDGSMSVFVNLAGDAAVFAQGVEIPVGLSPNSLAAVDMDFDEDLDLAIVVQDNMGAPRVRLARNDLNDGETIVFSQFNDVITGQAILMVLAGDVNLDGNADLVAVNAGLVGPAANGEGGGSVSVLLNETSPGPIGDLDGDGIVGTPDLLILLGMWGPCGDCNDCVADLNGDCNVDTTDLLMLLGNWS